MLSKDPFNLNCRDLFLKARTAYKKTCRKAEKVHRGALANQLLEIGKNDPKSFWSIIDKMSKWGKTKTDPSDIITPLRWRDHFTKLLNNAKSESLNLTPEMGSTFEPVLDGRITLKEMHEALYELKSGKAPGPDGILLEYLRIFAETFEQTLLSLLNKIFSNHLYPSNWAVNFLKPIFKKGETDDTDNYRGLAIGSALAKLFSQILLRRLTKYVDEKKLLSPNQGGFLKGRSTSDHIFLLQTIIEKVVKKGRKKLFAAFIDFKKAYDTVDRNILIRRLKQLGINGIFLKNIASMYMKTKYSIKLNDGHLGPIESNLGLKQGCPLSPMLFNLYIDDVREIFENTCHPIDLQGLNLSHFLYADDLVLISLTEDGLQNSLEKLHNYSQQKGLTISMKKSKTIIFNLGGKFIKKYFKINGNLIEPVHTFCYLGFDVKASGTVKHAMNLLFDKANKAMWPLYRSIARFRIPTETSLKLFHAYISPIALYNAENWAVLSDKNILNFSNEFIFENIAVSKTDILHRKFLKYILGVSKSCPNLAVYGETGEIPLSLKAFRLMINFWHRINKLPDETLVKKALLENIALRTNWIKTVEKLMGSLSLTDVAQNSAKLKEKTKLSLKSKYITFWQRKLREETSNRLQFFKTLKQEFKFEEYLNISQFEHRKAITKIRCSDHPLEVEQGRHKNIPREERICKICPSKEVETEEHFLSRCSFFNRYKPNHDISFTQNANSIITNSDPTYLGKYLVESFGERKKYKEWFNLG